MAHRLAIVDITPEYDISVTDGLYHSRDLVGTSLKGRIHSTYEDLCTVFGEPNTEPFETCSVTWVIDTPVGVATIYNWKSDPDPNKCILWSVGGYHYDVIEYILEAWKKKFK